jgi:hypothetical protein
MDALVLSIAPVYYKKQQPIMEEEYSQKLSKRMLGGLITITIHLQTFVLYFVIHWILRKTVFFFNIRDENLHNFIEEGAVHQGFVTTYWAIITGSYLGGVVVYFVFNYFYYAIGHPWHKARNKTLDRNFVKTYWSIIVGINVACAVMLVVSLYIFY